jgi:hypothetical protein
MTTQSLVVPSYRKDLPQLELLARSIEIMDSDRLFSKLYLLITDDSKINEYDFLSDRWIRMRCDQIFTPYAGHGMSGYINQQIAKFKIADHIDTDWFWILDSKNFLITPIQERLLYRENRSRTTFGEPSSYWADSWDNSLLYWGLDPADNRTVPLNITPFGVRTDDALAFLSEFGDFPLQFADLFLRQNICEFYLFSSWLYYKGRFNSSCWLDGRLMSTVWPTELNNPAYQPAAIKQEIQHAAYPPWCGGLHKDTVDRMNSEHAYEWSAYLTELGFFTTQTDANKWFTRVKSYLSPK